MRMGLEILRAATLLSDAEGIDRFLATVSDAETLRPFLHPGRKRRFEQYDKEAQTARYLLADGVWLVCFVVSGISLEDARAIARQTAPMIEWSTESFHRAVERALKISISPTAG